MSLRLGALELERIHADAVRAYPEEGCGVLLGVDLREDRVVERAVTFDNRQEGPRERRYLIAPEQLLQAEREGREAGLEVVGFYHSHPDHPARPSAFDLEHAWPYYSYVIVSVMEGRVADASSWRLAEDRSRFEPEVIEPVPARDAGPR